ncbi:RsmB/NOP family class I SAM-dependent RNA methyltransferase [Lachnospiraceae bacterium C1.1]|nr:RsmB/NOP family class I SAM-dependent RNA methyltransferase [Lachnospiraceae bacterium C1.1]
MQLPERFRQRMKEMLGNEYDEFEKSYEKDEFHALRINRLKKIKNNRIFENIDNFKVRDIEWCTDGCYYDNKTKPGRHPYHEAGIYYIQEPSAMAPVTNLMAESGEKVLDLCAAPGGKTSQIASLMNGKGFLLANEIIPSRAKILSENMERMGVRNCLVTSETPGKLAEIFEGYFDRILVDAPCSGEGMFRKNPLAAEEWSEENVRMCAERQDEVIDAAAEMLAPGGRMVYSTCTFAPEEDEGTVSRFLERHRDFHLCESINSDCFDRGDKKFYENSAEDIDKTVRIWPHHTDGEGHFFAVFERDGNIDDNYIRLSKNGLASSASKADISIYKEFERENLTVNFPEERIFKFGEQLCLIPEEMCGIDKLKVTRVGLHLGTLKKKRFEPSHALALALSEDDVDRYITLDSSSSEIAAYLGGQTLNISAEKGWTLICVDDCSIGWGKSDGRLIKNHYPKGLRKY